MNISYSTFRTIFIHRYVVYIYLECTTGKCMVKKRMIILNNLTGTHTHTRNDHTYK